LYQERLRASAAEENSHAKSRFLARMSHEIRTPISAVLGISEIQLQNINLPMGVEEAFAKIHSSASILLGIVNDILDLSKIEAGKIDITNDKYDVASLISDIVQINLHYLGSKPLNFIVDVDENIPTHLIGDELRIKQVLNNLLSNAIKYTTKGSVTLKTHIESGGQDNDINMVIEIKDTGLGMNSEQVKALFDEYTRFHERTIRSETGTGLGMYITYSLLQMMDATIDVESEEGKGTTITVTLPQQIGSLEKLGVDAAKSLRNFNAGTRAAAKRLSFQPEPMPYGNILVVDDVDANIYVAKGLMGLYDLQIETCTNGYAAIEKINCGKTYDIIFMDQMMPEINGDEAVSIIRQMGYSHPIIALTAGALVGQAEEFMKNGFDGFLSKPIQMVHLNTVLHKFVKDKHRQTGTNQVEDESISAEFAKGIAEGYAIDTEHHSSYDSYIKSSGMLEGLQAEFVRDYKDAVFEITDAIKGNDFKTAHRVAHTLKGLAGIISENSLMDIAGKTEDSLRKGEHPQDLLVKLDLEMGCVVSKIAKQNRDESEITTGGIYNED